ncbi:class III lanthionine synthetase LanKC [Pediococcus pentosaceus]|uniref:class III lanthionine synthetase LanKC n=1 Tax=Pediococcus pentosaceus TaxID=1255 RepID=UPI0021A8D8C1|nr:class III lanthionine synthetase LanKC [Pediococcus pentosaceus]MCT3033272.1 lanthionine synthetase [Pediococcus pentosaceus]
MATDPERYTNFIKNKKCIFYSKEESLIDKAKGFTTAPYDKNEWQAEIDNYWHRMSHKSSKLPDQGWKIHISANIEDAQEVLIDISEYLIKKKVSFKFVPSFNDLLTTYSKSGNRVEAGKFITIYPKDENEFCNLLDPLMNITAKYKEGPYILNDCPWKQSNVYFRYGAFTKLIELQNGIPVYVIKTPSGGVIEDKREPFYCIPDFVSEPQYVTENNTFPNEKVFSGLENLGIKNAIHFSSSGGIYEGEINGQTVVIKEGRPNIGLSDERSDGFKRVKNEYRTLKKLEDIKGVVNSLEYKEIWKHNYLVEEKIEGITLGEYLSIRFPFANQSSVAKYKKDTVEIIKNLANLVQQVHSKGIAIVDFQPENIVVNTNSEEAIVKLIDFESSEPMNEEYRPNLVIPEYASFQKESYENADWFALYKLSRTLFLPVEPTMIFNQELERRQNKNIENKFGKEIVDFLTSIRELCEKHTRIYRKADFYSGEIAVPPEIISRKNLKQTLTFLENGIVNEFDYNSTELIHGDVRQFDKSLSKYSISYGATGAIMALSRLGDIDKLTTKEFNGWLEKTKENIDKIISIEPDYDIGLFDGLCGIALTFYDVGEFSFAEKLFKYCDVETRPLDISIYSGISGIGLANLALYSVTKNNNYRENVIKSANIIIERYKNGEFETQPDFEGRLSLVKGWAGAVLFLWKAGISLDISIFKKYSLNILDKIIEKGIIDSDRGLSLLDKSKKIQRLLPYLDTGFAGITVLLIDMKIDDPKLMNDKYGDVFHSIKYDAGSFCAYCCSLFSGVSGLMVSSNAVRNYYGEDNYLDNYVNSLNNYAITTENNEILMPGLMGVKCSMDYETGASGVILALLDCKNNRDSWNSWLPLLKNNNLNIFNNYRTEKI